MTYIENIFLCLALPMLLSLLFTSGSPRRFTLFVVLNLVNSRAGRAIMAWHGHLPAFGLCQQLFHGAAPVQCRDHRH